MFLREHLNMGGVTPPFEYLTPTEDEAYVPGEALVVTAGKATKCGATAAPSHICVGPVSSNGLVPCEAVTKDMTYAVPLSVAGASLTVGSKVTLAADALRVTATTTSGVAEIVRIDGTAAGDTVAVKF